MACTDTGVTRRVALAHILDADGNQVEACCVDNFALNYDNTEVTEQKCQNGSVLFRTATLAADASFDIYQLASADILPIIFPQGTVTQVAAAATTDDQVVSSGSWTLPDGEATRIRVMLDNADGSAVTVNSVTAETDGLLVAATDYTVVTEDICVSKGNTHTISYIELDATLTNLTTDCQNLTINVDYTPAAGYKFNIQPGSYTQVPVSLIVYGYDLNNPSDINVTKIDKAYFNFSGSVISYGDPTAEIEAIGVTLSIPDDANIDMEVTESLGCTLC